MTAPAVVIRLELEAAPRLLVDSLDSREGERLRDWIETHPRYLDLIHAALELEAEEKTA